MNLFFIIYLTSATRCSPPPPSVSCFSYYIYLPFLLPHFLFFSLSARTVLLHTPSKGNHAPFQAGVPRPLGLTSLLLKLGLTLSLCFVVSRVPYKFINLAFETKYVHSTYGQLKFYFYELRI